MRIALIGYGKMGKEIERIAVERKITVLKVFTGKNNRSGIGITKQSLRGIDVCIDFSSPSAVLSNIEAVAAAGKRLVIGTTGWYDQAGKAKRIILKHKTGLIYSPNFSPGMYLFSEIVRAAAEQIGKFDFYDAAIHEMHHRGKIDSPSGTALMLGEVLLQHLRSKKELLHGTQKVAIKNNQLLISSTRVGRVAGVHSILFDSEADTIELTHTAKNRAGFALGALLAAEWIKDKKGFYTMNDIMASL